MPYPPLDGGAQAIYYTTRGLSDNGIKLKTIAINTPKHWINVSKIPEKFIQSCNFETITVDTRIKSIDAFLNLFRNESYIIERYISTEFEHGIINELKQGDYDIIQLEYLFLCKYISVIRKYSRAKIILRPQNIEYVIWERYLKGIRNPFKRFFLKTAIKRLKNFEQSVINRLDGIIAITEHDKELFQAFKGKKIPITAIPMGYIFGELKKTKEHKVSEPMKAYHLASMDWLPNYEAVEWLFMSVYPFLQYNLGINQIYIAGRCMPKKFFKYANNEVIVKSEINNPTDFQFDKSIMLVPLLSGSGIRAKIIEGLALGKAIISTTIGAQGINYTNNKNIIIADTPRDFAESVLLLMNNREFCKNLGENAYELGQKEYEYNNIANRMISFYKEILNE